MEKKEEKKDTFEEPKALNLQGEELTDESLEDVSGGGNTCHTGISTNLEDA